ncbi:MAG: hypothetical protein EOS65_14420 [Mesorhizobium sp.]|uniref:hypothetical protein n=1 Tax=Mesorhizobium sp. TaxID=1871066 RepID=UPI000FE50E86|nr:hypothetical protein [Mesorhizobium sp.]RWF40857.1 MAG: hypothetical protein EOS65_14420 [Mesorhizobium sp.]
MAISNFKKIDGASAHGQLLQYSAEGVSVASVYWPSVYANVDSGLDAAATSLMQGILAAGSAIMAGIARLRIVDEIHALANESSSRFISLAFRHARAATIASRDDVASAKAALRAPIESASQYRVAADELVRIDIRNRIEKLGDIGRQFEALMASKGLDTLAAIVPFMDRTAFASNEALSEKLTQEYATRRQMKLIGQGDRSDNYSSGPDPLRVTMGEDSLRRMATGQIGRIKTKEDAVSAATTLIGTTIDFVARAGNLDNAAAFNLLMGKSA